jgi:DNA-directed RNA polymerase specialized sigma24 family protein
VPLQDGLAAELGADPLELEDVLLVLEQHDHRAARLVELRFYLDLSMPEIAATLELPLRSLEREWQFVRAWLRRRLEDA